MAYHPYHLSVRSCYTLYSEGHKKKLGVKEWWNVAMDRNK